VYIFHVSEPVIRIADKLKY